MVLAAAMAAASADAATDRDASHHLGRPRPKDQGQAVSQSRLIIPLVCVGWPSVPDAGFLSSSSPSTRLHACTSPSPGGREAIDPVETLCSLSAASHPLLQPCLCAACEPARVPCAASRDGRPPPCPWPAAGPGRPWRSTASSRLAALGAVDRRRGPANAGCRLTKSPGKQLLAAHLETADPAVFDIIENVRAAPPKAPPPCPPWRPRPAPRG